MSKKGFPLYIGDIVEIEGPWWLKNVPSLSAVAVGEDGYPGRIAAPHPVAFAAPKRWLSERRDRDPAKRGRDRAQSAPVTALVADYLPMWRYDERLLQALPKHLRAFVDRSANGAALPS